MGGVIRWLSTRGNGRRRASRVGLGQDDATLIRSSSALALSFSIEEDSD
jgi:hypothetical protein